MDWHEATLAFPMMAGDEFAALVADIKENGLRHPITLLPDGLGLDGRNRLAACEEAGIEPRFDTYDGDDPEGFVISENVTRRHLKAPQKAISAARLMPERTNGKRRPSGRDVPKTAHSLGRLAERFGVSRDLVNQARALLDRAPDLVLKAEAGEAIRPLYQELKEREAEAAAAQRSLDRIAARDSDLADAVESGAMTLADALAESALREREAQKGELEDRKRADEAQMESGQAIRRFNAIVGQLIAYVKPDDWNVGNAEWVNFLTQVEAVTQWREKRDG